MKRAKKLYILLGVLAAACLATVIALGVEEYKEQIRTSVAVILEIPPEEVTALSWEYQEEALAFHKEEDTWLYDQDAAFPVDPEKIEGFLERFEAFGVTFVIEDVEDYGQYGLEGPLCTIQLSSGDTEYTITLGDFSTMDSQRYVSIGDGNAYLVAEDPLEDFDAVLSDMILDDDLPILQDVQQLQFSGAFAGTVQYIEDSPDTYCSQDVYFLQSEDGDLPLDTHGWKAIWIPSHTWGFRNMPPTTPPRRSWKTMAWIRRNFPSRRSIRWRTRIAAKAARRPLCSTSAGTRLS